MAKLDRNGQVWSDHDFKELRDDYLARGHRETDFHKIADKFFVRDLPEKRQCEEFLRDCRGMIYGDSHKANCGSFSLPFLIELFHGNEKIRDFYDGCILWCLSEKQGGGLVI